MNKVIIIGSVVTLFSCMGPDPGQRSEIEAQDDIYENNCYIEDTLPMTNREKQFCDSMEDLGYADVKILHRFAHSNCKKYSHYKEYWFSLEYKRKKPFKPFFPDSAERFQLQITKELFRNYLSDSTIMSHRNFLTDDKDFSIPPLALKQDSIFKLFGFKIVKKNKNSYKRVNVSK